MLRGLARLALAHLRHNKLQTGILVVCLGLSIFLPLGTRVVIARYREALGERARRTPLVLGARGRPVELTLAAIYFRESRLDPVPQRLLREIEARDAGLAVPLNVRFRARGHPVVATTPEYFEVRGLRPARGALPLRLGEAVLGADVADALGLGPGDTLFTDQPDLYDISKPSALELRITGVLASTGGPDDAAVFTALGTAWILEGLAHGHADPDAEVDPRLVLQRDGKGVTLSPALIEAQEVTPENVATFHTHGDPGEHPLSAVLVFPRDRKAGTLLKAAVNAGDAARVVVPASVIEDLFALVFRVRLLFDVLALGLAASTVLMAGLVGLLSVRLRRREIETLHAIGCSPKAVALLYAFEIAAVLLGALALAGLGTLAVVHLLPDLVRSL